MSTFRPLSLVKGQEINTGLSGGRFGISLDAGIIVEEDSGLIKVYDISSGSQTSFAVADSGAACPQCSGHAVISNSVIVMDSFSSASQDFALYYCNLPRTIPLQPCGPWTLITDPNLPVGGANFTFAGDIVAWPANFGFPPRYVGFTFYRLSDGIRTFVNVTGDIDGDVGTNGAIVAFTSQGNLEYYDTTFQNPTIVNTHIQGQVYENSVSGNIIAFTEAGPRLRYYDIQRNQSSSAGSGPMGVLGSGNSLSSSAPAVSGNRVVYTSPSITAACNTSSSYCLQYWNINARSYVSPYLDPTAAPAVDSNYPSVAISGDYIAFRGPDGSIHFVTVPMKGDLNQDGKVDIIDLVIAASCFGKFISSATC